jgi:hypothetical protein
MVIVRAFSVDFSLIDYRRRGKPDNALQKAVRLLRGAIVQCFGDASTDVLHGGRSKNCGPNDGRL